MKQAVPCPVWGLEKGKQVNGKDKASLGASRVIKGQKKRPPLDEEAVPFRKNPGVKMD